MHIFFRYLEISHIYLLHIPRDTFPHWVIFDFFSKDQTEKWTNTNTFGGRRWQLLVEEDVDFRWSIIEAFVGPIGWPEGDF